MKVFVLSHVDEGDQIGIYVSVDLARLAVEADGWTGPDRFGVYYSADEEYAIVPEELIGS